MIKGLAAKLRAAGKSGTLIRVRRTVEPGRADGYVMAVGDKWFLLAVVSDGILPEGYQAFRLADVSAFQSPAPHVDFVEAALDKRKILRPQSIGIDLSAAAAILMTASDLFPLVTIHREHVDPNVCHVGRMASVTKRDVSLHEITPDATWESKPTAYRLSQISRIDFGGPYEDALALVGCNKRGSRRRTLRQW